MLTLVLMHVGHAGDHGWLAGALQPLLSLDHFLAGVFVAGVLSVMLIRPSVTRGPERERSERRTAAPG